MEKYLIDGNNLMHKIPHIKDSRDAVIAAVSSRLKGKQIIFVFDGQGDSTGNVIYSGIKSADEIIRQKIEKNSEKNSKDKMLTVVSSDNEIIGLAKVCGCKFERSEDFWKRISANDGNTTGKNVNELYHYDDEKPSGISKGDIKEFKKYFS